MKRNQISKSSNLRSSPMDKVTLWEKNGPNWTRHWSISCSQEKQLTWCSLLLYPSNTMPGGEKGKKKTMDEYIYSQTSVTFSCKTGKMTVERDIPQLLICFIITGLQQFKEHSSWIKGNFRCLLWITGLFISYGLYAKQDAYLVSCCVC